MEPNFSTCLVCVCACQRIVIRLHTSTWHMVRRRSEEVSIDDMGPNSAFSRVILDFHELSFHKKENERTTICIGPGHALTDPLR